MGRLRAERGVVAGETTIRLDSRILLNLELSWIPSPNSKQVEYAFRSLVGIGSTKELRLLVQQGAFVKLLRLNKGRGPAKHGIALGTAVVLLGLSISAATAAGPSAEADGSALTATGALVGDGGLDLNTGECKAEIPGGNPDGAANGGPCGEGLNTQENIDAVSQEAKADANNARCAAFAAGDNNDMYGTQNPEPQYVHPKSDDQACATASAGPIDLTGLATIKLQDIIENGLAGISTGTILDGIVGPLGQAVLTAAQAINPNLLTNIDDALAQLVVPITNAADVSLNTGAIEAAAAAQPSAARGNSRVASVELQVELGGGAATVHAPFTGPNDLDTPPNTKLLSGSPDDLAAALLDGINATLVQSLNGALSGVTAVTIPIRDALVDTILPQLQDALLAPIEDGLEPLVKGTVNKQVDARNSNTEVSYTSTGTKEIEVTGLELVLFGGANQVPEIVPGGGATQTLKIARVHAGPVVAGDNNNGGNPGLQIVKTEKVNGDDEAEWTIRVHNPLNHAVDNVFVKDFYPHEIDESDVKVSSISQGSFNKNTGVWTVGTVQAGATETLRIRADVDEDDLNDGIENAVCVNRTHKPNHIQKNDNFRDDTDGCDTSTSKNDDDDNGDDDDDDSPKSISSGMGAGGDLSAVVLAGMTAMAAMGGSAARRRRIQI
jgi:hypothetical protein